MPLVDSDKWKATFLSLNQLRFHPANPRLPEMRGLASEREIIEELCKRGKVEGLAKAIADKGYLRNDRLVVVKDAGKNIVYEGNRRLCALKVLADPERAPQAMRKTFRRLAERAKLPKKIAVEIVPTRFEAEVVMYTKHAGGEFVMGWGPLQQATFVAAKIHQGDSIDDVSRTYGIPRGKVVLFQAAIDLYRMCRLAKVGSEAKKLLNNPDDFPYSTIFERLIEPTASRAALGFTVTEEGLFAPPAAEILPVLSQILEDAAAPESSPEKIDTRKLSTEAQQLLYIKKLGYHPSATGKTSAEQMEAQHGKKASSSDRPPDPEKNSPKTSAKAAKPTGRLLPRDLVCEVDQDKLVALVGEGKLIEIESLPHASALLLRCLLDLSLQQAMDERGCVKALEKKLGKDRNRIPTSKLLAELESGKDFDIGLDVMEKRGIRHLVNNGPLSYDVLHLYIHNQHWSASKESVTSFRDAILPIIRKALRKP